MPPRVLADKAIAGFEVREDNITGAAVAQPHIW